MSETDDWAESIKRLEELRREWDETWRPELDRLWREAFNEEPPPK